MRRLFNYTMALLVAGLVSQEAFSQKKSSKDYLITISTSYGEMKLILYNETPKHKANFIKLSKEHFYDGLLFHRVIKDFMIQGGDPTSKQAKSGASLGEGDVSYTIPAEFNKKLFHKKGAIAAARDNNPEKASSGCQFYIVQGKRFTDDMFPTAEKRSGRIIPDDQREVYRTVGGTPHLDMSYTVFGEVINGIEVIDKITAQPTAQGDRPLVDISMKVKVEKVSKRKILKLYKYSF